MTPSGEKESAITRDHKRIGRTIGLLLFLQIAIAIPVFTQMLSSIISPKFLTEAAANAAMIRWAILLTFVLSGITIAVALLAMPIVRPRSERLFWFYFGLAFVGLATAALEGVLFREMLSLSINHAVSGGSQAFEALAPVIRSEWSAAHLFNLATGHLRVFLFFLILFVCRLIPRWLAVAGLITSLLSTSGTTAAFSGAQFSFFMIAPAALVQLTMTLWLIWRGFSAPVTSPDATPVPWE